jgi:hypothetical protein
MSKIIASFLSVIELELSLYFNYDNKGGNLMFNDFIKNYNIIRAILRDVFLYGCFSREDLEGKRKISSRKISYEIRRIQQYVKDEFIRTDRDGRYKLLSLSYDSIRNTENFLVKTYMTKSFTRSDLVLYFSILMVLQAADKPLCFREIEDELISKGIISYDNISSKTIERKLEEMCSRVGVLSCEVIKRTKHFRIAEDIFKELTEEEIRELLTSVSLYKNIHFPLTAGYYCEDSIKDYITYERGIKVELKDYFQYKNLHFHPVIEEQILCSLLEVIHKRKQIYLKYNLPSNKRKGDSKVLLRPFKLRYDIQCGRFYLVSYDSSNKCIISRLDRIESVEFAEEGYERGNLEGLYERDMKYSWSSVPLGSGNMPLSVKLQISIDENKQRYILEKIQSEASGSRIEKVKEGCYHMSILVNDSGEMIPWLRSYSGYIKIIEGSWLANRLAEDWKEMLDSYGTL